MEVSEEQIGTIRVILCQIYTKPEQQHLVFVWGREWEMHGSVTVWICLFKLEKQQGRGILSEDPVQWREEKEILRLNKGKKRSKGYSIT